MDFAPTFLELAGVTLPPSAPKKIGAHPNRQSVSRQMTTFRGRDVHAIRGKSWLAYFAHGKQVEDNEMWTIHSSEKPIGWELFARGALRKGDWKIVHFPKDHGGVGVGDEGWELFNVVADPGETKDLAGEEPEKLEELLSHWNEYVVECGIVWGDTATVSGLSKDEAPQLWEDELDMQSVWMAAKGGQCPASVA